MARTKLIRDDDIPYYITARSNQEARFPLPLATLFEIFCANLNLVTERYGARVCAFALLPNQFHLLVVTPNKNIDQIMRYLMTEVSRAIGNHNTQRSHVFAGRYKWSRLTDPFAVAYAYKYIARSSRRANLARSVENYAYSLLFKKRSFPFLIDGIGPFWSLIPKDFNQRLHWLNRSTRRESEELIRLGLRRNTFALSRSRRTQLLLPKLQKDYLTFFVEVPKVNGHL